MVTSNGELLIVYNIVRNGSLWSAIVFWERSNFPRIWFRDLRFRTWGLEINHLNAHNFVWQGCFFLSLLSRNFDGRLSSNIHRFVIICICWDTPTAKASLWQLPTVSTVFNFARFHCIAEDMFFFMVCKWLWSVKSYETYTCLLCKSVLTRNRGLYRAL